MYMLEKIKQLLKSAGTKGMYLPFAHDPVSGKPSVTLLFPYLTFVLAFLSTIALHFKASLLVATSVSISFWALAVIFYMMRKITKAKVDLDDKSFELGDDSQKND